MIKFAPSLLSADFSKLGEELLKIQKAGADYVHIDVMDGGFVPNITIGIPVVESLRKHTELVFDVHLMIHQPGLHTDAFMTAGADIVTIHAEACIHLQRDIQKIKSGGRKVGVALNPGTPLEALEWVLEDLDLVLIMSVNPGFGGQKFIPASLPKIEKLANRIAKTGLNIELEVDGGIDLKNVRSVVDAGANVIVSGSAFFGSDSMEEFVRRVKGSSSK